MSGNDLLVDTNILIYLLGGDKTLSQFLQGKSLSISFVSELEILSYPGVAQKELRVIRELLLQCRIVDINQSIKSETIRLRKDKKVKLPDAIILATANYLELPFLTADSGFKHFDDQNILFYEV